MITLQQDEPPLSVHAVTFDALLDLIKIVASAQLTRDTIAQIRVQEDRVAKARAELEQARREFEKERAAFRSEQREWYEKSGREENEHRDRIATELKAHQDRLAAEAAAHKAKLAAEDDRRQKLIEAVLADEEAA
jgi:hypothetical protein